ncbi:hypothetical protein ACQ1Y8_14005, partial [Enterococcus faecalis]|uniref:hypothetical protein n=1 Tax=Enterococcus faecalis TaxID=1351 RepID=UPI003D6B37E6
MKGTLKGAWVLIEGKSSGFPIDHSAVADSVRAECIRKNDEAKSDSDKVMQPALFYREMVDAGILGIIQSAPVPLV